MMLGSGRGVEPSGVAGPSITAGDAAQRMLAAAVRLQDTCRADIEDLGRLRGQRQQRMAEAERTARASIERELSAARGLGEQVSLGSRLREDLVRKSGFQPRRAELGPVPDLAGAISEWNRLSAAGPVSREQARRRLRPMGFPLVQVGEVNAAS